jgi:hypothetical protein
LYVCCAVSHVANMLAQVNDVLADFPVINTHQCHACACPTVLQPQVATAGSVGMGAFICAGCPASPEDCRHCTCRMGLIDNGIMEAATRCVGGGALLWLQLKTCQHATTLVVRSLECKDTLRQHMVALHINRFSGARRFYKLPKRRIQAASCNLAVTLRMPRVDTHSTQVSSSTRPRPFNRDVKQLYAQPRGGW